MFYRISVFVIALAALVSTVAIAQSSQTYGFISHAAFFSVETKQANLLDPQVFVADPAAQAGTGPQGIVHAAGYRPAYGVDAPNTPLSNAQGKSLGITVGQWFAARGQVTLTPDGSNTRATLQFTGLIPRGRYSMFENHFAPSGITFAPLDGTGKTNSFNAGSNGTASLTVVVPGPVTPSDGILLVYHSDGVDHGMHRGQIGVIAHHQLITRMPQTAMSSPGKM
jgi:hypothetical protein